MLERVTQGIQIFAELKKVRAAGCEVLGMLCGKNGGVCLKGFGWKQTECKCSPQTEGDLGL